VTLYTVWHRVEHVTKDRVAHDKPRLRENVTGLVYRKELTTDTSYLFTVTAWNRWGESLLERDKMLSISTDFPDSAGRIPLFSMFQCLTFTDPLPRPRRIKNQEELTPQITRKVMRQNFIRIVISLS